MTFGDALEKLKRGSRVSRRGWNGKDMYLYITVGSEVPFHSLKEKTQRKLVGSGCCNADGNVRIGNHIDMKAADGTIVIGWIASQTDMLASDWQVVF